MRECPVAHVEAGLRTFDLDSPFPEEMNRLVTGRLATLHFARYRLGGRRIWPAKACLRIPFR